MSGTKNVSPKPVQAFIVEDHAMMRAMIAEYVASLPRIQLAGSAETGEEALEQLLETPAALVIVDVSLSGMNGFEFFRQLRQRQPEVLCLLVTGYASQQYAQRARDLGVHGYVVKGNLEAIRDGVAALLAGDTYFPNLEARV